MATRRITALALLERLGRHELETEARRLADLRTEAAELLGKRGALLDALHRETVDVSIEAAPYLGAYIRSARAEIRGLESRVDTLEEEARTLEDGVREAYRQMKTYGTALDTARADWRRERTRIESVRTEEQALQVWTRARG